MRAGCAVVYASNARFSGDKEEGEVREMHWVHKQEAQYNIARALKDRSWQVYGVKPGGYDPYSDCYTMDSWDGVAEKNGLVLCVWVGEYTAREYSKKLGFTVFPSPKGKTWHLQDRVSILKSGTGLSGCIDYRRAAKLVDRIERLARRYWLTDRQT